MVSKPTGRPIGRPRKPRSTPPSREQKLAQKFLRDGDRYAVALLDAMLALEMGSERACAVGVAVWQVGIEADPPRVSADGRVVTNWERERTQKGSQAATLGGSSCHVASQATPHPQRRRVHLAHGHGVRLHARAWRRVTRRPRGPPLLRERNPSARANSPDAFMLPMLAAKFSPNPSPEFPGKIVSTTEAE